MAAKKNAGPFEGLRALKEELKKKEENRPPKRSPAGPPPRPAVPEDDALTFHRLFGGVEPLDKGHGRVPKHTGPRTDGADRAAARGREVARVEAEAVHEHLRSLVEGGSRFEVSDDGRRVEGRRVELPIEELRRLRRGLLPIDGRLDLHGRTLAEGRAELDAFLRTTRGRGERCVLVIHGKGAHSPGGTGMLRGEIAAWLSQGPSCEHVAAFATARDSDGGEGAIYVLLRR